MASNVLLTPSDLLPGNGSGRCVGVQRILDVGGGSLTTSKRDTPEQIIDKLRQAEVEIANEATDAQVFVERWRKQDNTFQPHN